MTQKSSFYNLVIDLVIDFLRRNFSKHYIVKHDENNQNSAKHDFRICPHCHEAVKVLTLDGELIKRCRSCGKTLLILENAKKCKCGHTQFNEDGINEANCERCGAKIPIIHGIYKDRKKREFILRKNLNSRFMSWWGLASFISIMFVIIGYKQVNFPQNYKPNFIYSFFAFFILSSFFGFIIFTLFDKYHKRHPKVAIIIFSILISIQLTAPPILLNSTAPRWVDIPSEEMWEQQQHSAALRKFGKLKREENRYLFAKKTFSELNTPYWQIISGKTLVALAKKDFKTAIRYHRDEELLLSAHKIEFYELYLKYIKNLLNEEKTRNQC